MHFRSMTPDVDGLPRLGRTARLLGVRVPADISPDAEGTVAPGTGGLSVAPDTLWNLPHHRRPRGLGRGSTGPLADHVFAVDADRALPPDLAIRPDPIAPMVHAFMEPAKTMALESFEDLIAATRAQWSRAWP
jgi:hypothetical protein